MMFRASLGQKVQWLLLYNRQGKPKHRDEIHIQISPGKIYKFKPGKLLDEIKPVFEGADAANVLLSSDLKAQLYELSWFPAWIESLFQKRKALKLEPSLETQVHLLIRFYTDSQPKKNQIVSVELPNGFEYKLNGSLVLEKIAPYFFSAGGADGGDDDGGGMLPSSTKAEFLHLPWAKKWYNTGLKRRKVAYMRGVVTKSMKLSVILNQFQTRRPRWRERIDIVFDNSGESFPFYPSTFLDDLWANWKPPDADENFPRPGVTLDAAQKLAVETLPWFFEWKNCLIHNRQLRPLKRLLEEDTDVEEEEDGDEGGDDGEGGEGGERGEGVNQKRLCMYSRV